MLECRLLCMNMDCAPLH